LDCSSLKTSTASFTDGLCDITVGGWTENLVLVFLQIPIIFIMTLLGVTVVQRNKVDLQYKEPEPEKAPKK
jgi:hypothetical protein